MDPYRDTIPDDYGEDIKERIRKRDDPNDEGRPRKRARANTGALLPPESDDRQDVQKPLKLEYTLDKYHRERLQQGLRYIDKAARRKITPRTQEFLRIHKDAYKVALDDETPDEAARAVVQALDKVYVRCAFHLKPRQTEVYDRLMPFVKLRRLELVANYGDYLGHELQFFPADLKAAAISNDVEIAEEAYELGLKKTWITIVDELASTDVNGLRRGGFVACRVLGIDSEHMLWLIKEWGERNGTFHNRTRQYISDCRWPPLAQQLCRDLKELLNVAPDADTAARYEKVVLSIQSEYFDVMSRDEPDYWLPNQKAVELIRGRMAKEKKGL